NWQTGLVTGVAGALVGWGMLWMGRVLFGLGLGIEALGLGDADLMMMAGAFLGWQPLIVAFFVGVFIGLIFGIGQILLGGDNMMPFGPSLALGVVVTFLCWQWIGPRCQRYFFDELFLLLVGGASCVLMLGASYLLRLLHMMRRT